MTFAAQWLAYALPSRRFAGILADVDARLGADVGRYSFIVSDLHRLLLAGLGCRPANNEIAAACRGVTVHTPSLLISSAAGDSGSFERR